ncbi:MAG TPA: hydrogenase accessory protein HypB, partial [Rhodocyclaceae bacterium]|nr:hydrogenase accessory protein HypB [Rhodocyclaceae bacterium]
MCTTCGCGADEVRLDDGHSSMMPRHASAQRSYAPKPTASHSHAHGLSETRKLKIEQDILSQNDAYAAQNRQRLAAQGIFALNLLSSPGSGKTSVLVKTIAMLHGQTPLA